MSARRYRGLPVLLLPALLLACGPSAQPAPATGATSGGAAPAKPAAQAPGAPAEAPAVPLQKATMMIASTSGVFLPHKIAEAKGFFQANGLDTQVIQTASNVQAAAVVSGEAEFSGQFAAAIRQRIGGLQIVPVAAAVARSTRWLIARPQYNSVQDLRGKILLGSSPAGSDTMVLRRVLSFHGLDPDRDLEILHAGDVPARWASIQSGNADAVMFSGGEVLRAQEYGLKAIASAAEVIDMPENGIAVTDRRIAENPDLIKRAIRALMDAVAFQLDQPAEAAKVLAQWTDIEESLARQEVDLLAPALARDLLPSENGVRDVIAAEAASAGVTRDISPNEMTSFALLQEVKRERGMR
jgi:NitT/TauT family transport system substrate-binding protein